MKERTIIYYGNAEDIITPAAKLGWDFDEDDYIDPEGYIDWDEVIENATLFLQKAGVIIQYS